MILSCFPVIVKGRHGPQSLCRSPQLQILVSRKASSCGTAHMGLTATQTVGSQSLEFGLRLFKARMTDALWMTAEPAARSFVPAKKPSE